MRLHSIYEEVGKRVVDMLAAGAALIIILPIVLVLAFLIKIFDPGPVIFRHTRVGRAGVRFDFYKLRTMPVGTKNVPSDQIGLLQLTSIGRFLRRTNLDELPQLYLVFTGKMSLVGPRPSLVSQEELIRLRVENGALQCRPGLTGLAQVNSFNGMSVSEKAAFDGYYAKNISFLMDIKIILHTFMYLLKPPPIY